MTGLTEIHNPGGYYNILAERIRLRIRLTPGSKKERLGGVFSDSDGIGWLKANVRAVPEDGKANAALIRLLAKTLGIAKSSIHHLSGHTSRMKVFELPYTSEVQEILTKTGRG